MAAREAVSDFPDFPARLYLFGERWEREGAARARQPLFVHILALAFGSSEIGRLFYVRARVRRESLNYAFHPAKERMGGRRGERKSRFFVDEGVGGRTPALSDVKSPGTTGLEGEFCGLRVCTIYVPIIHVYRRRASRQCYSRWF